MKIACGHHVCPVTKLRLYMAGAIAAHLRRSEYPHIIGISIVFLLPMLFIAYGRLVGFAV